MPAPDPPAATGRRPRGRALLLCLLGSLVAVAGLGELALRALLQPEGSQRLGWQVRRPWIYADFQSDDDYFKLAHRFRDPAERDSFVQRDSRLGWLDMRIVPETYAHRLEATVGERRPVLLFGDSYAACATPAEDCWEALVERDPLLREEYALLNYGTAAFGLDQIYILLRATLPRWRGREPLVAVGIFVDDDIDRCLLSFRGCPKPRFELDAEGRLIEHPVLDIPIEDYLALHPPRIPSYLYRALTRGFPAVEALLPAPLRRVQGEHHRLVLRKRQLARRLLEELRALLEADSTPYFVILFHGQDTLTDEGSWAWKHHFLVEALEELGMPYVSSRRALQEDQRATGRGEADYFERQHYTAAGNQAVYQALARGIRGEHDHTAASR